MNRETTASALRGLAAALTAGADRSNVARELRSMSKALATSGRHSVLVEADRREAANAVWLIATLMPADRDAETAELVIDRLCTHRYASPHIFCPTCRRSRQRIMRDLRAVRSFIGTLGLAAEAKQ